MKILLGEGLITSDGEVHRRQRRIAAPAFHRQRSRRTAPSSSIALPPMRAQWQPGQPLDIASQIVQLRCQVITPTYSTLMPAMYCWWTTRVDVVVRLKLSSRLPAPKRVCTGLSGWSTSAARAAAGQGACGA